MPYHIDPNWPSGGHIRPRKMLEAFTALGYQVETVTGYGKERKKSIKKIAQSIKNGEKYDFLYSESSSMPTLLTEKHHLPVYPFLDFHFFQFCQAHAIKIGLFYRDIYWMFDSYKRQLGALNKLIATFFYRVDLKQYNNLINVLFLPHQEMGSYFPIPFKGIIEELPSGTDPTDPLSLTFTNPDPSKLNILYIGALDDFHAMDDLFHAINLRDYLHLTLCCSQLEWEKFQMKNKIALPRVSVIHKKGYELIPYYQNADILSLFFEPIPYRNFAMPLKLFDYLSFQKPMIATEHTAAGNFVHNNQIGWTIPYNSNAFVELTDAIMQDRPVLLKKSEQIKTILPYHTWKARAAKVIQTMQKARNS